MDGLSLVEMARSGGVEDTVRSVDRGMAGRIARETSILQVASGVPCAAGGRVGRETYIVDLVVGMVHSSLLCVGSVLPLTYKRDQVCSW